MPIARRAVLSNAAALLLLPAFAVARSAQQRPGGKLLTITYPGGASIRFDSDYYRDHHARLFMDIYGNAIERFELRTVQSGGAYSAVINVWIADFELFHARSTPAAYQRMGDDKKNFTNTSSIVQVDQVKAALGEPRDGIPKGCQCLSLLFPAGKAGHWRDDERCHAYADGLMKSLGGTEAVRRIEVHQGLQELDAGEPPYQGGVNIYLRNPTAFNARVSAAPLSDATPIQLNTTVIGIQP